MKSINRGLPPELASACKRLAHELARGDYADHRTRLLKQARARIEAGEEAPAILAELKAEILRSSFAPF